MSKSVTEMNAEELRKFLTEHDVEFPEKAKKSVLLGLAKKVEDEGEGEDEDDEDEGDDESRLTPDKPSPEDEEAGGTARDVDDDCLRQFQYKKVNDIPTVGGILTDPEPGSKAAVMKASLLAQELVSIFIPRAEGENPRVTLSVTLNGYRLDLPKQTYLKLPRQVADVIMESQKQQAEALRPHRIDRDRGTEEALS